MTGRNRTFAATGKLHLGDGFDAVLKLLPAERREAIARHLEVEQNLGRLRAARKREQRRIEKIAGADGADPRLVRWMVERLAQNRSLTVAARLVAALPAEPRP